MATGQTVRLNNLRQRFRSCSRSPFPAWCASCHAAYQQRGLHRKLAREAPGGVPERRLSRACRGGGGGCPFLLHRRWRARRGHADFQAGGPLEGARRPFGRLSAVAATVAGAAALRGPQPLARGRRRGPGAQNRARAARPRLGRGAQVGGGGGGAERGGGRQRRVEAALPEAAARRCSRAARPGPAAVAAAPCPLPLGVARLPGDELG
mmetsp:Transcript_69261/g.198657  ORF Transcript_69261/g.198657 Transcript_69261/m.198657 type:complete len:208 (-) Transcript_69261:428-1051(-)